MATEAKRREVNRLSPRKVATVTAPGRHSDGGNLYLVCDPTGAKRWVFIFRWKRPGVPGAGKLREMGLGSILGVSLARAREKASEARALLADGLDPIAVKRAQVAIPTFGEVADDLIATRSPELRSDKSVARWKRALEVYALPIRPLSVDSITTEDVLAVLKPIWAEKPETAQKTRGYIEAVLDAARAKGVRSGDNPARWRGHLDHLLARRQKLSRGHHAALAYADLPAFVQTLRSRDAVSSWALEFVILTAARTGEVLGATWAEVDLAGRVWTIPAARMKAGREHRVPLCARAVELLTEATKLRTDGDFIFPGPKSGRPLSSMALAMLLRRMERTDITVHGFRSTFRDWAGEATNFPRELAEAALAHTVGDETERAYRRSDALEKRRKLMVAWAGHCEPKAGGNVVQLAKASA